MSAQQLQSVVSKLHRNTGAPVRTKSVASELFVSERTALRLLRRAENVTIRRVGVKCGWLPLAA